MRPRLATVPALLALLGLAAALGGCGALDGARMLAPASFGMVAPSPRLYVEPAMSEADRATLRTEIERGRALAERFFGALTTAPYFVACVTSTCAERFGSRGARAASFGDRAIRLAPNGLAAALVAHEWTHAEVYARVGGMGRIARLPRWFDEGLAVVIADEPRHSPANWAEIRRRGLATPPLTELVTYRDWIRAVVKYGETAVDDPANLRVVYGTAGQVVREWLVCAGSVGTRALLEAVRAGEDFAESFARIGGPCAGAVAAAGGGV